MKIGDMKVGDRLVFGRYAQRHGDVASPIVWIKASKDNQFISEYVLDSAQFDGRETGRQNGNPDYALSNVYQFLNSSEDFMCYAPTHPKDTIGWLYDGKDGFLRLFDPYELASLDGCVDLPSVADIHGSADRQKLDLFKKKGFRAKRRGSDSYTAYFTCDNEGDFVVVIPVGGHKVGWCLPDYERGIRPKCKLKADIEVSRREDGTIHVIPFDVVSDQDDGYNESDFRMLLGI